MFNAFMSSIHMKIGQPTDIVEKLSTPKQVERFSSTSPYMQIPPSPFLKRLGFGTGVNVYLVERSPKHGQYRSPWAIKKINSKTLDKKSLYTKRLKSEAGILKELKHKNIVGFRSFVEAVDGSCVLAMEDGEKSLMSVIEDRSASASGPFPPQQIMAVAADVAQALRYLHHERRLLHGDLKSDNVLVQGDFKLAKLCDFGVTLPLDDDLVVVDGRAYVGTEPWSCPEVLQGGLVTNKADIFSFAMVLFEMLTLEIPHTHCFPEEGDNSALFQEEWEAAEETYQRSLGSRPPLLEGAYDASYVSAIELFHACSSSAPSDRPSALELVDCLSDQMPSPAARLDF